MLNIVCGEDHVCTQNMYYFLTLSRCALCQEPSDKPLVCLAKSKRMNIRADYDTLGHKLNSFRSVGNQPLPIDIKMLDEGDGISNTMKQNHAKWNTSCRLKCSDSRFANFSCAQWCIWGKSLYAATGWLQKWKLQMFLLWQSWIGNCASTWSNDS